MPDPPIRREPPSFRPASVVRLVDRTPRLRRVTFTGPELAGFDVGLPGSSMRLLVPGSGDSTAPEIPTWTGNEFLLGDGTRPHIRTLTPMGFDPRTNELDVDIVRHGDGPLGRWIERAELDDPVAVAGTGRGYAIDDSATRYLLAGDESAIPAITLLLPKLPPAATVEVIIEVADASAEIELDGPEGPAEVRWSVNDADRPGDHLVDAVTRWATSDRVDDHTRIWVAGEAAAVHRIRGHLFDEVGMSRRHAHVRGYWKVGRAASSDDG